MIENTVPGMRSLLDVGTPLKSVRTATTPTHSQLHATQVGTRATPSSSFRSRTAETACFDGHSSESLARSPGSVSLPPDGSGTTPLDFQPGRLFD